RQRCATLRRAIRQGLQDAIARGVRLGSHRRGCHRLTRVERSKGGQITAHWRRLEANRRYMKWLDDICLWRQRGNSLGEIAMKLADKGALTPDGRKIGRMLVYRILKRELGGLKKS